MQNPKRNNDNKIQMSIAFVDYLEMWIAEQGIGKDDVSMSDRTEAARDYAKMIKE